MIVFDPLWRTLKAQNISIYKLLTEYGLSHGTYDSLKHSRNVTVNTISQLCKMLHCRVEDICEYVEEDIE